MISPLISPSVAVSPTGRSVLVTGGWRVEDSALDGLSRLVYEMSIDSVGVLCWNVLDFILDVPHCGHYTFVVSEQKVLTYMETRKPEHEVEVREIVPNYHYEFHH